MNKNEPWKFMKPHHLEKQADLGQMLEFRHKEPRVHSITIRETLLVKTSKRLFVQQGKTLVSLCKMKKKSQSFMVTMITTWSQTLHKLRKYQSLDKEKWPTTLQWANKSQENVLAAAHQNSIRDKITIRATPTFQRAHTKYQNLRSRLNSTHSRTWISSFSKTRLKRSKIEI